MRRPIGLFDSGFGGLTVMKEVARLLPNEDLIYLGDTANLPYGNKSPQTVLRFAEENAAFLLSKNVKLLMIACHTACSHALEAIQEKLSIPVVGVIQPGLKLVGKHQRIALLGTTSTIESGVYQSLIQRQNPSAQIFAVPCPLFVPLIEEGFHNHPSAELIAEKYLGHLRGKVDVALLACTHYSLMRSVLQKVLGETVQLVEPAEECALQARECLRDANLLNLHTSGSQYQFYASDDPEKFRRFGEIFFARKIEKVERK